MRRIILETIPHEEQRYHTVGDWQTPEEGFKETKILVSGMGNPDYEFCVTIHELIEMYLALSRGISAKSVTDFDTKYESNRKEGDLNEPGDDPACPVYHEHQFATAIEKLVARELNIDWDTYNRIVELL